jgi:hypothetical protein
MEKDAMLINFQIRLEILKCKRERAVISNSPWIINAVEDDLKMLLKELEDFVSKT